MLAVCLCGWWDVKIQELTIETVFCAFSCEHLKLRRFPCERTPGRPEIIIPLSFVLFICTQKYAHTHFQTSACLKVQTDSVFVCLPACQSVCLSVSIDRACSCNQLTVCVTDTMKSVCTSVDADAFHYISVTFSTLLFTLLDLWTALILSLPMWKRRYRV